MKQDGITQVKKLNIDTIHTAFVDNYESQFTFPGESHIMWELDCVLDGGIGITSGADLYECTENEIVIHRSEVFHTAWTIGQNARILTISFEGKNVERYVPWGKFILNDDEKLLITLIRNLIHNQFHGQFSPTRDEGQWAELQSLTNLLETLLLSLNSRREKRTFPELDSAMKLFSEIVGYMQEHVCDALDTDEICHHCGVGRTALKELFKQYTGGGAMRYYNDLRMRHAINLMSLGKTMAEISEIMHFSSQNYFSSFFRRMTGMSPVHYKRDIINSHMQKE